MSIQVQDFKYCPGVNDSAYIQLLENALDRQRKITNKAVAKIKELSKSKIAHWDKKMEVHSDEKCQTFSPVWSCSNCGTNYDPALAQSVIKYCYHCGAELH